MFRRWRLRGLQARYLESCRNLQEGRDYWRQSSGLLRRILDFVSPVPLLGLQEDGARLLEALNRLEADCRRQPLREEDIRAYHRLLGGPGDYRNGQAVVLDSKTPRPPFQKVPSLMMQLGDLLAAEQKALDDAADPDAVLGFALQVHQRIAFIHPFADGNGRVARLSMNHLLRRYGHGYVVLPPLSESPEHFSALEEAHRGNLQPFIELARRHLHRV